MKKFILLVFISVLFFNGKIFSQFSNVWFGSYQHTSTNYFSNESRKVIVDGSGNSFVLADATSDIDTNGITTTSTWHYTVLLKYSSTGVLLNIAKIDVFDHPTTGFDNRGAFGMEVDGTGNIYIGFTSYNAVSNFNVHIAKFDNNLVSLWNYRYRPMSTDYGIDMKVASSGTVYAIVKSVSGANTQYHVLLANTGIFTATPLYSFDMGIDYLNSVVIDAGHNIYVTGYRIVSGFKNVLTASLDSAGTLRWKVTFNGGSVNRDDIGRNMALGTNNDLYIIGTSDRGAPDGNDVMVISCFTASGKQNWIAYYDNSDGNDIGCFISSPNSGYLYTGSVSGNNTVLIGRILQSNGVTGGKASYHPIPASPHNSITSVDLSDMKISSNLNFYITGKIVAVDNNGMTFSAAYLARYYLNLSSRNIFKLDYEVPIDGDFNASFAGIGIGLQYLNEDIIWLRDRITNYSTHQWEFVETIDFDLSNPIKSGNFQTGSEEDGDELHIYSDFQENTIVFSSPGNIVKIDILDFAGRYVKEVLMNPLNNKVDVSDIKNGIYIIRSYMLSGEIINKKMFID